MRLLFPALASMALAPAFAADDTVSLTYGVDYSTGKYGTPDTTETWSLPLSLKLQHDRWSLRASTSYLWVRGTRSVTPEGDPLAGGSTAVTTTQGYGDVIASVSRTVLDLDDAGIGLDLTGKIKFGTASVSKALGTGKNDYIAQASIYQAFGAWMPYFDLAYRWKGDPAGIDYANVWSATAGANYQFSKNTSLGIDYTWRERLTATGAEISEVSLYLNHKLGRHYSLSLYGVAGYSDASPAWETGLTLTQRF